MKTAIVLFCAALLCGCAPQAALVRQPPPPQLLHDQLFQPAAEVVDTSQVFAVTPAMHDYLQREILFNLKSKDVRTALFDALYRRDKLKLEYDAAVTRNAAQTFEARAGNCLSLAIMTAALARELKLTVQFQQVEVEQSWSRNGNLYFASNHVNLQLVNPRINYTNDGYNLNQSNTLTVDFIPIPPRARETARPLEDPTIVAMFLNNRAAELLSQGRLDDAYWAVRKAVGQDPAFLNAYNTLAVIYQNHGDHAEAEQSLRYALSQAPLNTIFMANLAQTLESQHKTDEALRLRARLAELEPYPPFHFFNLGREAMALGDYGRARNMFERELERAPDYHEFHFWLALADYQLGNLGAADEHMKLALDNSTTRGDHDLYAAKLDRLRAYEAHGAGK